ncbi:MAG TPA: hypothetical protein VM261_04120 [Kofleriaceae bacterium]|nr:hypothetical protein [Kofleriaceae bacterium]
MDTNKLFELIGDGRLWAVCGVAFALGAAGGFIQSLASAASKEELGREWWKRLLVGAIAAVAVMYVTAPSTAIELISGSIVAGYAGKALLDSLDARGRLAAAKDQIADTTRERDTAVTAAHLLLLPATETSTGASSPKRIARALDLLGSIRRPPASDVL